VTDYLDTLDSALQSIEKEIFPLSKNALQMSSHSILKDMYNLESWTIKRPLNKSSYGNSTSIPSGKRTNRIYKKADSHKTQHYGDLISEDSGTTNYRSINVSEGIIAISELNNSLRDPQKKSISKVSSRYSKFGSKNSNCDHFKTSVGFKNKFKMNLRKLRGERKKKSEPN